MGKFADLHKLWEEAKKKAPDKEVAKKTFKKIWGRCWMNWNQRLKIYSEKENVS